MGQGWGDLGAASSGVLKLRPNVVETIAMARFAKLLAQYTGDESHRALGEQAMRYLAIAPWLLTGPGSHPRAREPAVGDEIRTRELTEL